MREQLVSRSYRVRRWALVLLVLAVLLLLGDAIWAGARAAGALRDTRVHLRDGRDALLAGDTRAAGASFDAAADAAASATGALGEPGPRAASWLPVIGDDVDAVRSLARAASGAAEAGGALSGAAEAVGWDGESVPGYEPGAVDLDAAEAAQADLERSAELLGEAQGTLDEIDPGGLVGPLRAAFVEARAEVTRSARLAHRAAGVATLLPSLLGGEEKRSYLLVAMNLSDPRGSGGYPGSYGIILAKDGRIRLTDFAATSTLGSVDPVDPPRPDARRYARFGALTHFISTTYPPDWPTSAELFLRMWEASGRPPVDGAIGVDAVFLARLLAAAGGSVSVPMWPEEITEDNAVRILGRDTFETTDSTESNRLQTAIGGALWEAVLSRPLGANALGSAMSRSVAGRHLQVYVRDSEDQAMLHELGATGEMELGERDVMVTMSGITPNRAGYFAETSIDASVEEVDPGGARVELTITVENTAPKGPQSILLGFEGNGYPVGTYAALVDVFLPASATDIGSEVDGQPGLQLIEEEFGRPVVLQAIDVPPGSTAELRIRYSTPRDAHGASPEGSIRLIPPIGDGR
jgi:hypothetical protein